MVTPELRSYVKAQLAAGVAEKDVRAALVGIGWDAQTIQEVLGGEQQPAAASATTPGAASATTKQTATIQQQNATADAVGASQPNTAHTATEMSGGAAHTSPSPKVAAIIQSKPGITVTPTLRALTAIDSQFRAGIDKETIRTLLSGVGWDQKAIDEAFLAVEWEENILSTESKDTISPDAAAPKLTTIDSALQQAANTPTRNTLVAIDTLLRSGVRKGDIRTLLLGVGWEPRVIDEAFLAVEWREGSPTPAATAAAAPVSTPTSSSPVPNAHPTTNTSTVVEPAARQVVETSKVIEPAAKQPAEPKKVDVPPKTQPAVATVVTPIKTETPTLQTTTPKSVEPAHPDTPQDILAQKKTEHEPGGVVITPSATFAATFAGKSPSTFTPTEHPTLGAIPKQSSVVPTITITPAEGFMPTQKTASLVTPSGNTKKRHGWVAVLSIALLIVVLLAAAAGGAYYYIRILHAH